MELTFHDFNFDDLFMEMSFWTWQEIRFAYKNKIAVIEDIVNYAKYLLSENTSNFDIVLKLALSDNESSLQFLDVLCDNEKNIDEDYIKKKWLYALLSYLYKNKEKYTSVLDIVELIYSDFDYPNEMSGFIRYMPKKYTSLYDGWYEYLSNYKSTFDL